MRWVTPSQFATNMANPISIIFRHKKISIAVFAGILIGVYFIFSSSGKSASVTVYEYDAATKGNIVQSVSGSGQVSVTDQADVKSKVAGDVTVVKVSQGDLVKAGDILVQLDSTDAQKSSARRTDEFRQRQSFISEIAAG